ncbi:MAG: MFS transporter [Rhodobacter sp.]|uniref:MFS transporter n=1 Tax=Pararhodobacter sp. TaxID=2127056 RepID=UPI001DF8C0E0|nr:MFS transporter [Pararhodobacter sp.]MCB1346096.1 MFS transporter [Paracoccaceae bacterium]MCB1408780.1 MFS transporter [Paracoccaceae bacterium]MCC0073214.1 MFS transporter [Rhodobacter sp.]HPD91582.1 MFS transporter [Pararhodobacter sp.]
MDQSRRYASPFALLPVIGIPVFLAVANQTMISIALPDIGADLGQIRRLPWLVMGYMLALTVAGPIYGVLGDVWGRARMMQVALAVYILGSVLCAASGSIEFLAAGRLVQGLGGGGLMALSQALIADLVAPRDRGRAQGNNAAISVLASTLGPLVGGVTVATLGWRGIFLTTVPLALLAMVVLARHPVPHHPAAEGRKRFDLGGFLALLVLAFGLTAAIELAGDSQTRLWAGLGAASAIAAIAALVRLEPRAANPVFPPALFSVRAINRASIMVFFHGAALVSLVTTIPLFHAILRTDGALATATAMLALTVGFGIAGFITGNLVTMTGRTTLFPSLALPVTAMMVLFLAFRGAGLERGPLIACYLVTGLSLGTVMSVMNTIVQQAAPQAVLGRAAGSVTFFRSIGASVGTAITSLVLFLVAPDGTDAGAILVGGAGADPASHAAWHAAFQATFVTIAAFIAIEWFMGVVNPARRVE